MQKIPIPCKKLINHLCIIVFTAKVKPHLGQYAESLCYLILDAKKQKQQTKELDKKNR